MEAELRKLLEPIISKFIESLIKSRADWEQRYKSALSQINESLSQELDKTQRERDSLKAQKEENEKATSLTNAKLQDAVAKQTTLNNDLSKEAAQYSKLSREYEGKLKEIEENLKNSRVEKNIASDTLQKANKLLDDYTSKLNSLKQDFDKLALQKSEFEVREKDIKTKEKINLNKETELNEQAHNQNDTDLRLRAREAEVTRLIKRYKLEQSIKGE